MAHAVSFLFVFKLTYDTLWHLAHVPPSLLQAFGGGEGGVRVSSGEARPVQAKVPEVQKESFYGDMKKNTFPSLRRSPNLHCLPWQVVVAGIGAVRWVGTTVPEAVVHLCKKSLF